jgi:pimeloyl-ACP methyl ester carboxylesterase
MMTAETRHVAVRGGSIAVHVAGEGPPLLFIHGFPLDHRMWAFQSPLSDVATLVMPDLRGFGGSLGASPIGSIRQLADDCAAVIAAIAPGERAVACGLSMGGYVAEHLAVHHSEIVRGLVLVDTRIEADTEAARAGRRDLAERVARVGSRIAAEAMVPKLLAPTCDQRQRSPIAESLHRMILEADPATIQQALAALADRPDMTEPMRSVRLPTLLVVGEQDSITPPEVMRSITTVMPQANLAVLPRCGHMTPMEDPDGFNRLVRDFLSGIPAAT